MFLDGYLFARDFIPALADGENALINTLGLGGLKSQLDSQLSKLPGLGELIGKLMNMLGFGEKEGEQELARGGKVKEGMQKKKDIPNPVYTTPTPFIKGFDIPTEGEGQFRRFAGGGLYVFSTAPAGAPKLMGHGKGFGDTYPHHHPKPGGNVPRAGGIPRDYLISELKNPSAPDSKGDRHPIRAGVSGTVDSVGEGWGAVRIKDANGPIFRSGHMTGIKVKMGQQVNPSTIIGIQDAVGMSNGYVHAHIEGKTAAIHNAWIKANSGSKSTGSDDVDVPTGDDGSSTPKMSSPNSAGDKLNADGTPQEKTPQKPKKINIMDAFNKLGGADLMKSYIQDIRDDEARSSGSSVSGGGGSGAAQIKQEQDALNRKSELLKSQSESSQQREEDLQGGSSNVMILTKKVFGATPPAPQIITPGSGMTPLLTGN